MLPNNQFPSDQPLGSQQLKTVWKIVSKDLRKELGDAAYELWFGQSRLLEVDQYKAVISAPGSMYAIWIDENFHDILKFHLSKYLIDLKGFSFDCKPSEEESAETGSVFGDLENSEPETLELPGRSRKKRAVPRRILTPEEILEKGRKAGLSENYTFENFVVGKGSELAKAAAAAVIENPGQIHQPLYCYSASGLGKTHLLHAIGWEFLRLRPHARIIYVGAEKFANDYIDGIRTTGEKAFRKMYREVDLLLIDDVQFLSGKSGFQTEFYHTFNSLVEKQSQIVIASDCLAPEIAQLEERLVSRMQWGMTVDIKSPGEVSSEAILRKKRDQWKFTVSDEMISMIVDRVSHNVRQLEGALIRTAMACSMDNRDLNEEELDELLADIVASKGSRLLGVEEIKTAVADYFSVEVKEMEGKRRTAKVTESRQVAMFLCREMTGHSLKEIASSFAKDHSCVVYAVKTIKAKCQKSESLKNSIELLRRRLTRGNGAVGGSERACPQPEILGDLKSGGEMDPDFRGFDADEESFLG